MSAYEESFETFESEFNDELNFEAHEEYLGGEQQELDEHFNESLSDSFSYTKQSEINETSDITSRIESVESDSFETFKLIQNLRTKRSNLLARKNNAIDMLVELYEKGLNDIDVPKADFSTDEEARQAYEDLLIEFNIKKETALKRIQNLIEKTNDLRKYLEVKYAERAELRDKQYDLELKTGVGMINSKTGKQLSHDNVVKMLDLFNKKESELSKFRLKYIKQKNKCEEIKKDIENLGLDEKIAKYDEANFKNKELEKLLENKNNIIKNDRKIIYSTIEQISDIKKKITDMKEKHAKKKEDLKEVLDETKRIIESKMNNRKMLNQQKSPSKAVNATFDSLMLNDYHANVAKAPKLEKRVSELQDLMTECDNSIRRLKAAIKVAECEKSQEYGALSFCCKTY